MKLKDPTGWFAAGPRMLQALLLLSDGAFKLFAYLSLTAGRGTGRVQVTQVELARALGKSRNSINAYLEELTQQGFCLIKPSPNQHQPGEIEIADTFWPYHKLVGNKPSLSTDAADALANRNKGASRGSSNSPARSMPRPATEPEFIEQVRTYLLKYAIFCSSFGAADRKLAAELFRDGISFNELERALLLGLGRKYVSSLNSTVPSPIYSLAYFLPCLDEVFQTPSSDEYWEYLRRRLKDFDGAWRDVRRPPRIARPDDKHRARSSNRGEINPNATASGTKSSHSGPTEGIASGG
jgi:Winged helix-turn-helix DNA-binding